MTDLPSRGSVHKTGGEVNPFPVDRINLFWSHVKIGPHCWEWESIQNSKGYGYFRIDPRNRLKEKRGIRPRRMLAHRFSWLINRGPIPEGILVCHHCDNPLCVRPDHLFLGTAKDNMQDAISKHRPVGRPRAI